MISGDNSSSQADSNILLDNASVGVSKTRNRTARGVDRGLRGPLPCARKVPHRYKRGNRCKAGALGEDAPTEARDIPVDAEPQKAILFTAEAAQFAVDTADDNAAGCPRCPMLSPRHWSGLKMTMCGFMQVIPGSACRHKRTPTGIFAGHSTWRSMPPKSLSIQPWKSRSLRRIQ
jgi:hypothetical protein